MKTILSTAALAALLPLSALACAAHDAATTARGPEVLTLAAATTPATATIPADGAAVAAPAPAASVITVSDAHARSANPRTGAAFMTLTNSGATACTLTGVTSDVADLVELHTHKDEGGVMKMLKIDSLTVPANGTHTLARGGDHVMFLGLRRPLADGDSVEMVLDLGDCGQVPVTVPLDNGAGAGAAPGMGTAPAMGHGHGMMHGRPAN